MRHPLFPRVVTRGTAAALVAVLAAACGRESSTATAPNDALTLAVPSDTLFLGSSVEAELEGLAGGAPVWSSSNPAVISVTQEGVLTAVSPGRATISVRRSGQRGERTFVSIAGGVVPASGGTVTTPDSAVQLAVPAGALPSPVAITVQPAAEAATPAPRAIAGAVYTFGPAGTQFAEPVTLSLGYDAAQLPEGVAASDLRVGLLTENGWEIVTEGASVDPATRTVRAAVRHFSTYGIVVDPCVAVPGDFPAAGATYNGSIAAGVSCQSPNSRRFGTFANFATVPALGEVVALQSTGTLNGIFGLKVQQNPGFLGATFDGSPIPGALRVIMNGDPVQLFVQGRDSTQFGSFAISRIADPGYRCPSAGQVLTVLTPGASTAGNMTTENICSGAVAFPATNNPFLGQPLRFHRYATFLSVGQRYPITVRDVPANTPWTLSIFVQDLNGQTVLVGQSRYDGSSQTSRTLTIQPIASTYFTIEVSTGGTPTGQFADWQVPLIPYTVQVGRGTPVAAMQAQAPSL